MTLIDRYFNTAVGRDLYGMVLGEKLGEGTAREVHSWLIDPRLVAKIETGYGSFQNVQEWEAWRSVEHTDHAQWFAPCVTISGSGVWLLQRRTKPCLDSQLPDRVPAFFSDLKVENWGMLKGRPVCHDYGLHLLHERGMTTRMRKAVWS